ncbi:hypothetical protein JXA34_02535 [Patescibacteria group bacterium]|nr:hypothetical protein [Patescibacteria group bacterium]
MTRRLTFTGPTYSDEAQKGEFLERMKDVQKNVIEAVGGRAFFDPEGAAIALRLADSGIYAGEVGEHSTEEQEAQDFIERLKESLSTPSDRFDVSVYFLTACFEEESELERIDGINLSPVSDETLDFLVTSLQEGIEDALQSSDDDLLLERFKLVADIATRAVESTQFTKLPEEGSVGSTYIRKKDLKSILDYVDSVVTTKLDESGIKTGTSIVEQINRFRSVAGTSGIEK